MTAIINTYTAKPDYYFEIEISIKTKNGTLIKNLNRFLEKEFVKPLTAKRYIENHPIPKVHAGKQGFIIDIPGKWISNIVFELRIRRKSNSKGIPLNRYYDVKYILKNKRKNKERLSIFESLEGRFQYINGVRRNGRYN